MASGVRSSVPPTVHRLNVGVLFSVTAPQARELAATQEPGGDPVLDGCAAGALDVVGARGGARRHDFSELGSVEDERGAVVGRQSVGQLACRDETVEGGTSLRLAVVVRTAASGQQPEPVVEGRELQEVVRRRAG
jgi:hypothetical protein